MRLSVITIGVAILVSSCGSDVTAPIASGVLTFSYTGAGASSATTFTATARIPLDSADAFASSFAFGSPGGPDTGEAEEITAVVPRSSTTVDFTLISLSQLGAGTRSLDSTCAAACLVGFFGATTGTTPSFVCGLTSGSLTVISMTSSHASGRFAGSGRCHGSAGVTPFAIINGTFDVDLAQTAPIL